VNQYIRSTFVVLNLFYAKSKDISFQSLHVNYKIYIGVYHHPSSIGTVVIEMRIGVMVVKLRFSFSVWTWYGVCHHRAVPLSDAAGKILGGILGVSNIIIKKYKTKNRIT